MILHPGVLALLLGSAVVLALGLAAAVLGVRVMLRWDFSSSSELQLTLERRTVLVSTVMKYALAFTVCSALLLVYTLEDIHDLFVGAMCATGSLNANPIGWWALGNKVVLLFLASLWLVVNHIDEQAEDYPLVRMKYGVLPLLVILIAADFWLQAAYFGGLTPEVITSCCGSLFSEHGSGVASDIAALPPEPMMAAFYASAGILAAGLTTTFLRPSGFARGGLALAALAFLFIAGLSIISFISPYLYEMPTHHCPFDVFQRNYRSIGYPLFLSLFSSVLFGLLPGALHWSRRIGSLAPAIDRSERTWLACSALGLAVFIAIVSWPILFGSFVL